MPQSGLIYARAWTSFSMSMSSPAGSVGTRALRIPWYGISAHAEGDERLCLLPGRPWEIRSAIIYEDAAVIGLMDICSIRPGHARIIPREHFDYFDDLPDVIACRIIHLGQRLARALKTLYGVPRVAFLFSGGDHAHAHAHVIPMHEKTDITSRRYATLPKRH